VQEPRRPPPSNGLGLPPAVTHARSLDRDAIAIAALQHSRSLAEIHPVSPHPVYSVARTSDADPRTRLTARTTTWALHIMIDIMIDPSRSGRDESGQTANNLSQVRCQARQSTPHVGRCNSRSSLSRQRVDIAATVPKDRRSISVALGSAWRRESVSEGDGQTAIDRAG